MIHTEVNSKKLKQNGFEYKGVYIYIYISCFLEVLFEFFILNCDFIKVVFYE